MGKLEPISLIDLWSKDKDQLQKEQLELNLQELQIDGSKTVIQKQRAMGMADRALKNAIMEAGKTPDFQVVYEAYVKYSAARVEYELAVELSEALFNTGKKEEPAK